MKLERVTVRNFRCFEEYTLELDPEFTLLVGENASGKTALLDALGIGLAGVLPTAFIGSRRIRPLDARGAVEAHDGLVQTQRRFPIEILCEGDFGGPGRWGRVLPAADGGTVEKGFTPVGVALAQGSPERLPLLCSYGTRRLWRESDSGLGRPTGGRLDAYFACLDPGSSLDRLNEWMRDQAMAEAQDGIRIPHLDAIERAVCQCVQGARKFQYRIRYKQLEITWEDGSVQPFDELSDGYRNVVATVADIAWRAAVLNAHHGAQAAEKAEGVVLIDELDLLLHPSWQRRVIGDLRRTFPTIQFVATTHSPQVIATAQPEWLRILERGTKQPTFVDHVHGWDSNSVLQGIMGVGPRPDDAQAQLDALFTAVEAETWEEAERLLAGLEKVLGPEDTDLVRARWAMHWERGAG